MSTLSVRRIESEKPDPKKDRRIADGQGLYLKVAKNGKKTFTYRFTYAGRSRQEVTLGTYPEMSLADARAERLTQSRLLGQGLNPIQEKHAAHQSKKQALTVSELIEEFYTEHMQQHRELPAPDYQTLKLHIGQEIGKVLVPDVTKFLMTRTLNKVKKRGLVIANRVLSLVRQMFEYAVDQHYIEDTPVTMTRKAVGGREKSKTTNLSVDQITLVLAAMRREDIGLAWQTRAALRLALATAKRPGEVVTVEWSHVDLERGIWVNPKHLTKEKREDHTVFLSPYAVRLLKDVRQVTGLESHVFHTGRGRKSHIDRHSISRAILRLHQEGIFPFKFTPHDLRRTFSTRMADMGKMPHVVEKILDHLMVGSMGVYNRASYLPERREAMNAWGAVLEELDRNQ